MTPRRITGVALLLIGVSVFAIGMDASDSVADRLSNLFTGHYTDETVWYLVVGVASAVGGLMLFTLPGRRSVV